MRPETVKFLKESIGSNLLDITLSRRFVDMSLQVRETKSKINYWDYTKIKSICTAKETVNKMKRQPIEWEKIYVNDISTRG